MDDDLIQRALSLRAAIENLASDIPDEDALEWPELFPHWERNASYELGDRVRYQGVLYVCLQSHRAFDWWTPTDSPSLWARVLIPDPDQIPDWVQPESTNPYMTGDKVTHNGSTWISTVDHNVWEPGVYGWELVIE